MDIDMANLAIKGHSTRGKEVINLLEMLGANSLGYKDTFVGFYYYIECGAICSSDEYPTYATIFTLEEFLEKYPYKVGDKVVFKFINTYVIDTIKSMKWYANGVVYTLKEYEEELMAEDLQFCKGEEFIEGKETFKESERTLVQIDFTRELCIADEVEVILGDYEFVLKDGKTYFVKKNKYPKTYEECCEVLNLGEDGNLYTKGHQASLIQDFHKLFICRAAYWKIAGEQMGLGKPWQPDWDWRKSKFCIGVIDDKIEKFIVGTQQYMLSFPTEEIRDVFYDNFKELIEHCKELL